MHNITNSNGINENLLNKQFYFQSLFLEACRANLLSASQIERIQLELVELMGKEVERYTNDESSSIPIEKAQNILQSITYSIGYFLKNTTDVTQKLDILRTEKISDLYYKGMKAVSDCKTKAHKLLLDLQCNCLKLNNYAYQDTISNGLPPFFHDYNIEFGAHEIPSDIDYPLFETITDLIGVEYIYEYLEQLTCEDRFIRHFSDVNINRLLKGFDKESEHMLINIYELVITNALGCMLLDQQIRELHIDNAGRYWLQEHLEKLSTDELKQRLEYAFYTIAEDLKLDSEQITYAKAALPQIAVRLMHNLRTNTLDRIFIAFPGLEKEEIYEDGTPMEDEKLRLLIDRLRSYRTTSDKMAIIKDTVRSTVDFIELLDECFYEEEYEEIFTLLNTTEKEVLKKCLLLEYGQGYLEEFEPQKLWQKILFQ